MIELRPLTRDDLPAALRLREQAGWNQTAADVERFLALQGDGCFGAELDGRIVGTVAVFIFGDVAWIAFVLVDAALRGQGIGQTLMRRALAFIDERGVPIARLDATPLGQPLYEKLGFVAERQLVRYQAGGQRLEAGGKRDVDSPSLAVDRSMVQPGSREQLDAVVALDRRASAADRRELLTRLIEEQPEQFRVVGDGDNLRGFCLARPGSRAWMLGPCVADAASGPALLADALQRFAGESIYLDVPLDQPAAVALAESHGLAVQRPLLRMRRGPAPQEEPLLLWASSGPEKG